MNYLIIPTFNKPHHLRKTLKHLTFDRKTTIGVVVEKGLNEEHSALAIAAGLDYVAVDGDSYTNPASQINEGVSYFQRMGHKFDADSVIVVMHDDIRIIEPQAIDLLISTALTRDAAYGQVKTWGLDDQWTGGWRQNEVNPGCYFFAVKFDKWNGFDDAYANAPHFEDKAFMRTLTAPFVYVPEAIAGHMKHDALHNVNFLRKQNWRIYREQFGE